jgi:Autophagy protein ATG9
VLAPFVFVFLAIHFFLRNAEQLYHHPSSVGARRWSPLARWRLREFNELPHYIDHRCLADAVQAGAEHAPAQMHAIPSPHDVSRSNTILAIPGLVMQQHFPVADAPD